MCVQRSCNHHHTYQLSLLARFDENYLNSSLLFSEMQANPTSISAKPPACENTLQLVRNAQLAAGAGGGVWSKPPEKCRCCYCRRSDRRRSAADAGAEQSSTGRVVDTWCWHQQAQPKSDPDYIHIFWEVQDLQAQVQVLQEQMRSSDARDAAPASCNFQLFPIQVPQLTLFGWSDNKHQQQSGWGVVVVQRNTTNTLMKAHLTAKKALDQGVIHSLCAPCLA